MLIYIILVIISSVLCLSALNPSAFPVKTLQGYDKVDDLSSAEPPRFTVKSNPWDCTWKTRVCQQNVPKQKLLEVLAMDNDDATKSAKEYMKDALDVQGRFQACCQTEIASVKIRDMRGGIVCQAMFYLDYESLSWMKCVAHGEYRATTRNTYTQGLGLESEGTRKEIFLVQQMKLFPLRPVCSIVTTECKRSMANDLSTVGSCDCKAHTYSTENERITCKKDCLKRQFGGCCRQHNQWIKRQESVGGFKFVAGCSMFVHKSFKKSLNTLLSKTVGIRRYSLLKYANCRPDPAIV